MKELLLVLFSDHTWAIAYPSTLDEIIKAHRWKQSIPEKNRKITILNSWKAEKYE